MTTALLLLLSIVVPGASVDSPVVLLVGGLGGDDASSQSVRLQVKQFEAVPQTQRRFRLLAVPVVNPEQTQLVFPPTGAAYKENVAAHKLWRWIATQAPDMVVIAGERDYGLADALAKAGLPAKAGTLAAVARDIPKSEGHRKLDAQLARTPQQVAAELAKYYAQELKEAVYISSVALIGQLRLGNVNEVEKLAAPFLDGSKDSLANATGSHLSGHLLFAELAERTGNARYVELVKKAADLGFNLSGEMNASMPFHGEMSDAVFMGCPILAKAGKLTRDPKYFDMALRHFRFMENLCLRPDGLYRHSPLDEAAWARGNGFPALGMALTLTDLPKDHPAHAAMLDAFQKHMAALAKYQDENGMWRQVVDHPSAWSEFSATAMIGTAMLRGIRMGWLDSKVYRPLVDKAWTAIKTRTTADGILMDVCEGTVKQASLEDYLRRTAIYGRDPRGGAMALLFATEMAGLR